MPDSDLSTTPLFRDGPAKARARIVLSHGAGAPVTDPFMEAITQELVRAGVGVVRFEFPYMAKRREDGKRRGPDRMSILQATWKQVLEGLGGGERWVIGGKSMGGRVASRVADEVGARGVVCLGYPFHPPGKPENLRTAHLESLRTPALVLQGTRDTMGSRGEVEGYSLSDSIRIEWLEDGDHSLKPRKKSGHSAEEHLARAGQLAAEFVKGCF